MADHANGKDGGKKVIVPSHVFNPSKYRPARPAPTRTFITNREFVPSLVLFAGFICIVYGVQWLVNRSPTLGFAAAVVAMVFMAEWERRARFAFGRLRQRAHFDVLNVVKLPRPIIPPTLEMEPLTPYIPVEEEKMRTDAATLLKQAEDTMSGGRGHQSAMLEALVNVLKSTSDAATTSDDKGSQASPPSEEKGSQTQTQTQGDNDGLPPPPAALT